MRLLEQRPSDAALYNARVRQIVSTSQAALGVDEIAKAQALVQEMQHLLVGRLHVGANPTDSQIWAAHRAKLILHAVNDVVERYSKRFGVMLGKSVEDAYRDGAARTEELTRLSGAAWNLPAISEHEINIAARYSPDLIRGYDDYAKGKLGDVIKRFTLTGRPPAELMAELAGRIDTRGTPFHDVAYRAELITRTEMARVAEMGSQARMLDFVREFPDAGMQQIHLLSERACDDCQAAFDASPNGDGVWDVGDEEAPVFPLHPNCLCSMAPYFEGLSRNPAREARRRFWFSEAWSEDLHPRDANGRFGSGGAGTPKEHHFDDTSEPVPKVAADPHIFEETSVMIEKRERLGQVFSDGDLEEMVESLTPDERLARKMYLADEMAKQGYDRNVALHVLGVPGY